MSEEINKIILKSEDFLEDAEYLFKGKRFEAVVNRCYYAMFTIIQGIASYKEYFFKNSSGYNA